MSEPSPPVDPSPVTPPGGGAVSLTARSLVREPLLHFALLGALLVGVDAWRHRGAPATPAVAAPVASGGPQLTEPIVLDGELRRSLDEVFTRVHGHPPSSEESQAEVERFLEEEVLFREGWRRGLQQDDPRVRQRVASKMAAVLSAAVVVPTPTDEQLRAHLAAHPEKFARPAEVDFVHAFVSGHDAAAQARAQQILQQVEGGADPGGLGETFRGGRRYRRRVVNDLVESFGAEFVQALATQPPGRWFVRASTFGQHVVRIDRRTEASAADFPSIREVVAADWTESWKDAELRRRVGELIARYPVVRRP